MKNLLYIVLVVLMMACTDNRNNQKKIISDTVESYKTEYPINIDVFSKYNKRSIKWQEMGEVIYIPIETTKDILLSNIINGLNISDNVIVTMNQLGTIYLFDSTGHQISQFNRQGRGPNEYESANKLTVDFTEECIYLVDFDLRYKVLVYSLSGSFIRSFNIPNGLNIRDIQNYDKDNLLIYMIPPQYRWKDLQGPFRPYYLMSKIDGTLKQIELEVPELKEARIRIEQGNRMRLIGYQTSPIIRNGADFYISDFALDMIYKLNDTILTPFIKIEPSVQNLISPIFVSISLKSTQYTFLSVIEKEDSEVQIKQRFIAIDHTTGEIFEPDFGSGIFGRMPENSFRNLPTDYCVIPLSAERLEEAFKKGELEGELQSVASRLKIDDNPVLMLLKIK